MTFYRRLIREKNPSNLDLFDTEKFAIIFTDFEPLRDSDLQFFREKKRIKPI